MFVIPELICLKNRTEADTSLPITKWASSCKKEKMTLKQMYPADDVWKVSYNSKRSDGDREVENTVRKNWQFRAASPKSAWLWHEEVGYMEVSIGYYLSITAGQLLSEIEFQVVNSLASEEPLLMSTTEIAALTAEKKLAVHPMELQDLTAKDVGKYFKQKSSFIYLGPVAENVLVYQISSQCFKLKKPHEPVLPMLKSISIPAGLELNSLVREYPKAEPWDFRWDLAIPFNEWSTTEQVPPALALLQEIATRTNYGQYFNITCAEDSGSKTKTVKVCLPNSSAVRDVYLSFFIHPKTGLIHNGDASDRDGRVDFVIKDYFSAKLQHCVSIKEQLAYIKEVIASEGVFLCVSVRED